MEIRANAVKAASEAASAVKKQLENSVEHVLNKFEETDREKELAELLEAN